MNKFKIDIYTLTEKASHSSDKIYFGSIVFETEMERSWVLDFLHHAGRQMAIEGIQIITYNFENYTIIELIDFFREGDYFKELIYQSQDLLVTNEQLIDNLFTTDHEPDYLIIGDDAVAGHYSEKDLDFLHDYQQTVIKSEYLYEWGATGFWDNYLIGIASSMSVLIIDKLVSLGFPKSSIQRFKLPTQIRKKIANEYNILPESLFLESYNKNKTGVEVVCFRNINYRFLITIKNGELANLTTEKLIKYV
ncbi:hypothetical protein [Rufibacter roseus]|uniref:Uncharacterized protein n=1 Tax=Rufibacter roseus TaxID=1567108 RepID=A0ABW2DTG0_9BACT|nr:hypothetical protein [Rufibacter roseus]